MQTYEASVQKLTEENNSIRELSDDDQTYKASVHDIIDEKKSIYSFYTNTMIFEKKKHVWYIFHFILSFSSQETERRSANLRSLGSYNRRTHLYILHYCHLDIRKEATIVIYASYSYMLSLQGTKRRSTNLQSVGSWYHWWIKSIYIFHTNTMIYEKNF